MKEFKYALLKSSPVIFSYIFLGTAFGIMMHEAGCNIKWTALASIFIYTGAFQMALAGFIKAQTAIFSVLATAFALGSRHIFYGISFIEDFKKMKGRYGYMIFSLTDEAYALFCDTQIEKGINLENYRFYVAMIIHLSWITGSVMGGILGNIIPFDFAGIDFTMTALFVTVLVDQWKASKDHRAAIIGIVTSIAFLVTVGKNNFILPALALSTVILLFISIKETKENE